MAGAGFKNFTTGEVLTASDVQGYLMDQSVMVFAGTAARASAIASPSEGMVTYRTDDDAVEVYDGSAWNSIGGAGAAVISSPAATGSYSSGGTTYNYYTFTASGTVTVDKAGFADVLVVGGGGGSETYGSYAAGGGGGGMLEVSNTYLAADSYTVVVGAGGVNTGNGSDNHGNDSRLGETLVGVGGGGGGGTNGATNIRAGDGGGSGAGGCGTSPTSGPSVYGQGNLGAAVASGYAAGGGAGAAASGSTPGNGRATTITGTSVTYAKGGSNSSGTTPNTVNSGNGGGGIAYGNSGIVIVRVAA